MPATWEMGDSHLKAQVLGRWGTHLKAQVLGRWGTHLKAHLPISVEAEVFIRRERGTEHRSRERVAKFSTYADKHGPFDKANDGPVCAILASRHPGSTVKGQQISQSWDA